VPTFAVDDLYAVLGVPRNATVEEIKSTYYKYAKQLHPDLPANKGNEEARKRFSSISAAYDILGDEKKRKKYDTYGHQAMNIDDEEILGQINNFFSQNGEELKDLTQGANIEHPITLTFEEAALGTQKKIEYKVNVECDTCGGAGAAKGTEVLRCQLCSGAGYTSSGKGLFHQKKACSCCSGYGTILEKPCKACTGTGTVQKTKKLLVKIPPGVDNEHQVKIQNRGHAGNRGSGKPGALFIAVTVSPHSRFNREKDDIHVTVPITVSQAILGDVVQVPSLTGSVDLTVPAGVQPGEKRLLKGRGINERGNQIVHFQVVVPKKLTKEQADLIRQFGKGEIKVESKQYTSQLSQTWQAVRKFFGRE